MTLYLNPETGEIDEFMHFAEVESEDSVIFPDLIEVIKDCTGEWVTV